MCFVAVVVATISCSLMSLSREAQRQVVVIIHHQVVQDRKKEGAWFKFRDFKDIDLYIL